MYLDSERSEGAVGFTKMFIFFNSLWTWFFLVNLLRFLHVAPFLKALVPEMVLWKGYFSIFDAIFQIKALKWEKRGKTYIFTILLFYKNTGDVYYQKKLFNRKMTRYLFCFPYDLLSNGIIAETFELFRNFYFWEYFCRNSVINTRRDL